MNSIAIPLTPGVELLESMRSVGYSFETAVADLIDNSISAESQNIYIQADIADGQHLYILDDGTGMDTTTALEALRLAGTAQKTRSKKTELGRFGLGLKTASLSQARKLTLVTKEGQNIVAYCWDIDHVIKSQSWEVLRIANTELESLPGYHRLAKQNSGTLIIWQNLDYLMGEAENKSDHLGSNLASLEKHLGFVFHRFLEEKNFKPDSKISIFINGNKIQSIDPFLSSEPKTQVSQKYEFTISGYPVTVRGYTLPHQRYISSELKKRFDLNRNMRDYQGFYIYRHDRLISWGQWFGLSKKEELNKQSRISVDISSDLDSLWQIDIRKSRSEPPYEFKQALRPIMENIVGRSKRIHTFRGRNISNKKIQHYWNVIKNGTDVKYEINKSHPDINALKSTLNPKQRNDLDQILKDLVNFIPYNDIYLENAKNSNLIIENISDEEYVRRIRKLKDIGFIAGKPMDAARELCTMEPFSFIIPLQRLQNLTEKAWENEH